ncbi:DUF6340 family protein [Bacteroides pyogenes]|uniref:DUF6340 family protein n=1 Tax=Bacteroides pyogenes TaxID=310300 RepID=UPI0003DBA672|nr:DUF6340 family protein [Bacteroides pyogenes]MBB3893763.1 hypothetical protein [Bacteroides pyogenes]GAE21534.1 hypothetical protein JCM10003_996 [Bacteroides pyogenes JCM 10003]SUV33679.1 Uncharacterised protein [Bacteroides pyogenes]
MKKIHSLCFISMLFLTGCESIRIISIDYMQPAEVSFPNQLRRVGIVNNTAKTPDNKMIVEAETPQEENMEIRRGVAYANGDSRIATESLAQEIAHRNYFDKVVVCDSALRSNDRFLRESTLSEEEVKALTSDLDVDCIIALENLQIKAVKTVSFLPQYGFLGTVSVKAYPTVSVYLPGRKAPMVTLTSNDSIFWEDIRASETKAKQFIPDSQIIEETSEFAGTIPVNRLIPFWEKADRYIYAGGSAQMREAAIHVKENNWDKACELWKKMYNKTTSNKKKMQNAINIAVYYELKDSLDLAEEWMTKAQDMAKRIDKINTETTNKLYFNIEKVPHYYQTTVYLFKLKERNRQLPKLKMQMSRFNDDF